LARRHGEALQVALDVREPEQQEVDVLVLQPLQRLPPRLRFARCPGPALDLRNTKTSLKNKSPRRRAPEATSPRSERESIRLRDERGSSPAAPGSRASH